MAFLSVIWVTRRGIPAPGLRGGISPVKRATGLTRKNLKEPGLWEANDTQFAARFAKAIAAEGASTVAYRPGTALRRAACKSSGLNPNGPGLLL